MNQQTQRKNGDSATQRRVPLWLGALVLSAPLGLLATSFTDIDVSGTAEFGSGATFGTASVSIGEANAPEQWGLAVGKSLFGSASNDVVVGRWNIPVSGAYF